MTAVLASRVHVEHITAHNDNQNNVQTILKARCGLARLELGVCSRPRQHMVKQPACTSATRTHAQILRM